MDIQGEANQRDVKGLEASQGQRCVGRVWHQVSVLPGGGAGAKSFVDEG